MAGGFAHPPADDGGPEERPRVDDAAHLRDGRRQPGDRRVEGRCARASRVVPQPRQESGSARADPGREIRRPRARRPGRRARAAVDDDERPLAPLRGIPDENGPSDPGRRARTGLTEAATGLPATRLQTYPSATQGFVSVPIPSTRTSTTSPGLSATF